MPITQGEDKVVVLKGEDDELARVTELSRQDAQQVPDNNAALAHTLEISRVSTGVEREKQYRSKDP